jgi:hypothetical protein
MVKTQVTLQETVEFLNSLLEIDRHVVTALFSMRIGCNKAMADHETVQCGTFDLLTDKEEYCQVGMIGILNGLFGADQNGWGHICANYDEGIIKEFKLLPDKDVKEIIDSKKRGSSNNAKN